MKKFTIWDTHYRYMSNSKTALKDYEYFNKSRTRASLWEANLFYGEFKIYYLFLQLMK